GHKNSDGENSSLFSLVNGKWRILGIDSAWEDHDLVSPQPQWIRNQIREAEQAGQKVMLLCHHQLFSAFEPGGEKMVKALGDLLESPKIHSWFWGHEHRCAIYKPYMNIPYARLVGHGGVPVYQWKKQSDPVAEPALFEYRGRFKEGLEQWALFGFAVLDFDGPNIKVQYINEDGEKHYEEMITAA
ncbi:MAG: Calcineurin-like phosphoesterase, partial [Deltaproteobacteria bacterium]|nr:Calcineurin-like phosphoesterase [Deltaproteobacteria bacterium]